MSWLGRVLGWHRDLFRGVALGSARDGDFWLFLFAKQQPLTYALLELRRKPLAIDLTDHSSVLHIGGPDRREYDYLPPVVRTERDPPFDLDNNGCDVWVRRGAVFKGTTVVLPHAPEYLERFLAGRDVRGAARSTEPRPTTRRMTKRERTSIQDEYPWISDSDLDDPRLRRDTSHVRRRGVSGSPPPAAPPESPGEGRAASDDDGDAELERADEPERVDVVDDGDDDGLEEDPLLSHPYFYTRIVGGRVSRGSAGDVDHGMCGLCTAAVRDWCLVYNFPRYKEFCFTAHVGREAAVMLAQEYARRGNYFHMLYATSGDVEYEYTEDLETKEERKEKR